MAEAFRDKTFIIILLVGIGLRLGWSVFFPTYPETDFMWYHVKASEISEGKGFLNGIYPYYTGSPEHPTAFRTIGYPGTLGVIYYFTGSKIMVGKLFNVFLASLSLILLYLISRKFFSRQISLLALGIFCVLPLGIVYPGILGSETLFQTLLLLCAYFTIVNKNIIALGIFSGYLSLVRPIGIYFIIVLIGFIILDEKTNIKKRLIQAVSIMLITGIIVAPWLIRNYNVFGTPVYSTNGGYVAYVNNNPYATGSWSDPYKYPNSPYIKYKHDGWFDELGMHLEGKKLAVDFALNNPGAFTKLAIKRIYNSYWGKLDDIIWAFTTGVNQWHPLTYKAVLLEKIVYKPFYLMMFVSMGFVFFRLYKRNATKFDIFIIMTFLYFNGMMFLLEGNSRYVYPLHPLYCIIIAEMLYNIYLYSQNKNMKTKIAQLQNIEKTN